VVWQVTYTDEFQAWWDTLDLPEQESILASVDLLQSEGPALGRPHVDTIRGSRRGNMKELRTQHAGRPYRTFFSPLRQSGWWQVNAHHGLWSHRAKIAKSAKNRQGRRRWFSLLFLALLATLASWRATTVPTRQSAGLAESPFFAFDPRRMAVLLIGGDKTGDDRFYERMVPLADAILDAYLNALEG
jgi:hypothetical protein